MSFTRRTINRRVICSDFRRERLTILIRGRRFEGNERNRQALADHGIELIEDAAVELIGQSGQLQRVRLRSGVSIDADLVFFSIAHHARVHLAEQLGCQLTEDGCLLVDSDGQTTVEGLYAAGDVTPGIQRVSVAVGKGTIAGVACYGCTFVYLGIELLTVSRLNAHPDYSERNRAPVRRRRVSSDSRCCTRFISA